MPDKDGLNWEASVGVTYASLMSAVALFFTGILIAQYKSFSPTIKVPLIFLIISTFSFIFSATIYSNAGAEITLGRLKSAEKYMIYAKNIVELLGLYLFILATPMVIGAVTNDNFLRLTTIVVALGGFAIYSQSKFSVLEKELLAYQKRLLSLSIVALSILLYFAQSSASARSLAIYGPFAIVLAGLLMLLTVHFCRTSKQYKQTYFRDFREVDAEALSRLVDKNLNRVKSRSYPKTAILAIQTQMTAAAIRESAKTGHIVTATYDNKIAGMACLRDNRLSNVYTDPALHRKSIGRMLVDYIEEAAVQQGYDAIEVVASTVDHAFYAKLGYQDIKTIEAGDDGRNLLMRKELQN